MALKAKLWEEPEFKRLIWRLFEMTKTLLLAATALMLMAVPVRAEEHGHSTTAAPAAIEAAPVGAAEPAPVTQPEPVMEQCFDEHGMEVDCPKADTAVEVSPEAEAEAADDADHSEKHDTGTHAEPAAH